MKRDVGGGGSSSSSKKRLSLWTSLLQKQPISKGESAAEGFQNQTYIRNGDKGGRFKGRVLDNEGNPTEEYLEYAIKEAQEKYK